MAIIAIHEKVITVNQSTNPKEYQDTVWGLDNSSPFIRFRGRSVNHMTLGLIGYGFVGKLMVQKARAFGMNILVYDSYAKFENLPDYVKIATWDEVIGESDVISVHCALTPQTKNMF